VIEIWIIIVAYLAPDYVQCVWLDTLEQSTMRVCLLNRPAAASIYQLRLDTIPELDGYLTFTKCETGVLVENGETK